MNILREKPAVDQQPHTQPSTAPAIPTSQNATPTSDDNGDDDDDANDTDAGKDYGTKSKEGNQKVYTPMKIDKAAVRQIVGSAATTFDEDYVDLERVVGKFLDSNVAEAEAELKAKHCKTLPHTLGYGVILTLKSLMTSDRYDIDAAMDALSVTVDVAQAFRKEQSIVGSLAGLMFGSGGGNSGNGGGGFLGSRDGSHFRAMTRIQRHAEIAFAEAYLLRALLSLLTDTNMVAFMREGLHIRQAYSIFKGGYRFLRRVWGKEGGPAGLATNKIDAHFVNAVYNGVGIFNLILSILPPTVLRIFEIIGFSGHRDFGLKCLELAGDWHVGNAASPNVAAATTTTTTSSLSILARTRKSKKPKIALDLRMPDNSPAYIGLRTFLCDLSLQLYHNVLGSMMQMPGCNIPLAQDMIARDMTRHPNSFLYLTLRAKLWQSAADPEKALEDFQRVMDLQNDWRQLAHVCMWDMGLCHAAMGRWSDASKCFATLFDESAWSPAVFLYFKAIFMYMHETTGKAYSATSTSSPSSATSAGTPAALVVTDPAKKQIQDMLREVPKYCKKIAGKSIPLEKYLARKSRKYFIQNERLLLSGYEVLYIWGAFEQMPKERLRAIATEVDEVVKDLDRMHEEYRVSHPTETDQTPVYSTYYDDVCLARFFKGLIARELAFPTHLTLVPEHEFSARITAHQSEKKVVRDLQYASRQLEHIVLEADKIELDHWILPFARYELGLLHTRTGNFDKAAREFTAAMNGGYADDEVGYKKHKMSMENSLHLKVHNSVMRLRVLQALTGKQRGDAGDGDNAETDGNADGDDSD